MSTQFLDTFLCDLFLLKKLPSQETVGYDLLHLLEFVQFLKMDELAVEFADVQKAFTNWMSVQEDVDEIDSKLGLDGGQVQSLLDTNANVILPLYIQNCNACLIIRKEKGQSAKVSVFTVHPNNKEIMSRCGDLVTLYPEVTISVKDENLSMLCSDELATLLQDLFSNQIGQIRPKSTKAGSKEDEGRDVVSSVIVTEWLVALLGGELAHEKMINKKIRNSIEWSNAMHPYRRSGLWMSIKIILQLLLVWKYGENDGKVYYKALLMKYFIHIANKHFHEMSDEVKLQVISKLAIRLKKLDDLNDPKTKHILTYAYKFIAEQRKYLDNNWNIICSDTSKIDLTLGSAANKSDNIYQQLVESKQIINFYRDIEQQTVDESEIVPKSFNRSFSISQFITISQTDGGEASLSELFIIEEWVRKNMITDYH